MKISWRTWCCFLLSLSTIFLEISLMKPADSPIPLLKVILYSLSWVILTVVAKCLLFFSPPPTDEMEFATLWCRSIKFSVKHWSVSLRDFPQPMIDITNMHVWGRLIGAEREGTKRGTCCVLKFYGGMGGHELKCVVLPCRMGWQLCTYSHLMESYPAEWGDNFVHAVTWWSLTL